MDNPADIILSSLTKIYELLQQKHSKHQNLEKRFFLVF